MECVCRSALYGMSDVLASQILEGKVASVLARGESLTAHARSAGALIWLGGWTIIMLTDALSYGSHALLLVLTDMIATVLYSLTSDVARSLYPDAEARTHVPTVVFVDEKNRIRELRPERASRKTPARRVAAKVAKKKR